MTSAAGAGGCRLGGRGRGCEPGPAGSAGASGRTSALPAPDFASSHSWEAPPGNCDVHLCFLKPRGVIWYSGHREQVSVFWAIFLTSQHLTWS